MKARKMHRCISLILAFAMIFSGIYVYAEEKSDNIASVKFGKNVAMNNISGVAMGQTNSPNLMERDGVEAWGLLPQRYLGSAYLYVDVDDRFAHNVSDGSVFEIQVTYYSQGNGYFQLFYDAQRNPKRHHNELIFIGDEMKWKTVTFTLDDVYFGDRLDESYLGGAYTGTGKHDLALTIRTRNDQEASPSDVLISEIKVIKYPAANPVTFYSSIDESGSAFPWYQKEKIITNHFENTTDEVVEADVTYTAITTSGYKVWEKQDKLTLNPKEKKDVDINIETDYCDKYNYYVDIKSEKPEVYRYMSREGKTQVGLVTENVELATNQAGAKTVYEFRITWKELLGEEYVPQAGHEIGFSILFNENDGTGRKGWIEFGSGIGKSKDANQFAYINLTDN